MEEKTNKRENSFPEHRKESKIILAASVVLTFVLVISAVIALILLIFSVEEIEVVGDSRYTYSEIIEACGIKNGARLYYVNESRAEKKTLEKLTYLKSVKINSYFPNRVKIEIEEFEDVFLLHHEKGYCYVNAEFEILEIIESPVSYDEFDGIFVKLENKMMGEIGDKYDGEDSQRAIVLVDHLKRHGFYQYLDIIDVSKKYDISFVIEKKYKFVLGSMTDVEEKIDASFKVCFSDGFKRENNSVVDSTDKKRVILRYVSDEIIREEFDFCEN